MPFTEKTIMDLRLCFVSACLREDEPMSRLCERYGISRKTGYKWLGRYASEGACGLEDRSRAPRRQAQRIPEAVADRIVELRQQRPTWGPRKLLARLSMDDPETVWPSASTVGDLLARQGLVSHRPKRRPPGPSPGSPVEAHAANDSWSADAKGWFRTQDGVRCEPLTITDNYSRYIITCQAVPCMTLGVVRSHFEAAFREYGLPRSVRTDNGAPFGSRMGLGGLTRLSVWFLKLGIRPDHIAPARPDQNGRHERMHRTLAEDTASPPASTIAQQQERFDRWRQDFNTVRPHQALGQKCPQQFYQPSSRLFPLKLIPWEYPADHHVRKVSKDGYITWMDEKVYLSEALAKETVGIVQQDDRTWRVKFRDFDLAVLDCEGAERSCSCRPRSGPTGTKTVNCYPCDRSEV